MHQVIRFYKFLWLDLTQSSSHPPFQHSEEREKNFQTSIEIGQKSELKYGGKNEFCFFFQSINKKKTFSCRSMSFSRLATRSSNSVLCTFQVNRKATFCKYLLVFFWFQAAAFETFIYGFRFIAQVSENRKISPKLIKCKYTRALWMKFFDHPEQQRFVHYAWNYKQWQKHGWW